MYRWMNHASYGLMFVASLTLGAVGCSKTDSTPAAGQSAPAADTHDDHDDHDGHDDHDDHDGDADHDDHDGDADHAGHEEHGAGGEVAEALASLSPEDRAAVEKQGVCPVTGEPLGSMGAPIKVTVKGRDVFICCAGCRDSLEKDPDKYLAKLAN